MNLKQIYLLSKFNSIFFNLQTLDTFNNFRYLSKIYNELIVNSNNKKYANKIFSLSYINELI